MNRILAVCVVALLALLAASPRAHAQPCPVTPGSSFGDAGSSGFFWSFEASVRRAGHDARTGAGSFPVDGAQLRERTL